MKTFTILMASALTLALTATAHAAGSPVKLYALNCGTLELFDITSFSDEGHFDGQKKMSPDPCYLIRHKDGDLLWDTGLDQAIASMPDGAVEPWGKMTMAATLTAQLAALELAPNDVEFLAISHWHPDHTGNAKLFANSTFLVQEAEHAFIFSPAIKSNAEAFASFAPLEEARTVKYINEHDVFGDGSVVIKSMPGHTDGSAVLLVRLEKNGPVLLTGDLYTHKEARKLGAVPTFNASKDQTRASHRAFEALAKAEKARVIVHHDMEDFKSMPVFPAFLD